MALLEVYCLNSNPKWRAENQEAIREHAETVAEVEANARLISAAPELLAALLECLPYVREEMEACADLGDEEGDAAAESIGFVISRAEAAIAKATGN